MKYIARKTTRLVYPPHHIQRKGQRDTPIRHLQPPEPEPDENCRAYDYVFKSSLDYRIGARRSAPGCRTWLQGHVKRSLRGNRRAEIAQTFNLTMSAACFPMMSFCHYTIANHENGSHGGVGTCLAERLFGFNQGSAHELFVSVGRHGAGESNKTCLEGFEPPTF